MNEADLHVDGEDDAEPHRVEARRGDDRQQNWRSHQDDRGRRNKEAADQKKNVDEEHQQPFVGVQIRDALGQRLGQIKRSEHVTEQHGCGDDGEDHHRFPHRIAQDRPQLFGPP